MLRVPRAASLPFVQGRLHAPYVVALRSTQPSDRQLLEALNLAGCEPSAPGSPHETLFLGRSGGWTLVVDDWFCTLWHLYRDHGVERALARRWGVVFSTFVGDADQAYGLDHFRGEAHLRSRFVASPKFTDRVLERDFGDPLPGETAALFEMDGMDIALTLLRKQGIRIEPEIVSFRAYTYGSELTARGRTR